MFPGISAEDFFGRYKVNVIVSHDDGQGAPVVIENNPTYYALFGRVDYRSQFGAMTTDHMMIKAGSIHRANGSYLIMQALDVLCKPAGLGNLEANYPLPGDPIQNLGEQFSAIPFSTLDPQPIPLDVKMVLVGNPRIYQLLRTADEDFRKLFRVKADFSVAWAQRRLREDVRAVSSASQQKLRHFHKSRHHESSSMGRGSSAWKLSAQFIDISDLLTEANFWAGRDTAPRLRPARRTGHRPEDLPLEPHQASTGRDR
jgi:predicted ATP-dependent protease